MCYRIIFILDARDTLPWLYGNRSIIAVLTLAIQMVPRFVQNSLCNKYFRLDKHVYIFVSQVNDRELWLESEMKGLLR